MTGLELRQARERKGWTQQQAALALRLSQPYLSLLETDKRHMPKSRVEGVLAVYDVLPPSALPYRGDGSWAMLGAPELAEQLAGLGYPGFSYMRARSTWNPAELLVAALTKDDLESRVAEALPWLVLAYSNMDWGWVVTQTRMHEVQNRLGFVLTLARELAERRNKTEVVTQLREVEDRLQTLVLMRQTTFCHEHMTQAERRWLMEKSTPQAKRWHVLSDLSLEHLSHAG